MEGRMTGLHRFRDWRLRTKMAVLLVLASLLPLGAATWISIRNAEEQQLEDTAGLLAARGDQLVGRIDTFNLGYQRAVNRLALVTDLLELLQARPAAAQRLVPDVQGVLRVWPASDPAIRGVAVLDQSGTVLAGTESALVGRSLAGRSFVQEALRGNAVISDVFLAEPEVGSVPTIAFLAPMLGPRQELLGAAVFWVHASNLHDAMTQSNGLAGNGSFAALFDHLGIRIAHSSNEEILFRPGVALAPATIDALVAEQRFGAQTRTLLEDVRAVSVEFGLASAHPADSVMFRGFAPGNQQWNYVVGRSLQTVSWTVYYMIPERALLTEIARITRQKLQLAAVIMLAAMVGGAAFAGVILKPIGSLSAAAQAIAAGDQGARAHVNSRDELGQLGTTFNDMADRIQEQAAALVKESEKQYRKLFETLIEGFCTIEMIFDESGKAVDFRYVEVNAAFEKHSGMKVAPGKRVREIVPDIEEYWFEIYGEVARTGKPLQYQQESKVLGRHFEGSAYRIGGPGSHKVGIVFNDVTEKKLSQIMLREQMERLSLLQQITRAIGERQDLESIFQVVVRTLEDRLPIDFCCICLYEPEGGRLVVSRVGAKSQQLAMKLALTEQAGFSIDDNGLSRCVRGHMVHEPDISEVAFPFPTRLAAAGLRTFVAAPLLVEGQVFGVLIAARLEPGSFTSGECEFLRQLSEHVALAAHHAQLYTALQTAYEDLRQTQQAAMQQDRLRALGQMASGIAHDINNAISPVALYAESLLERETTISEQGRSHLQTIQRAIHDVAATVSRMREFYRQREPQLVLAPVQLNELVPQVVDLTRARWSTMPQQRGVTIDLRTSLDARLPVIMGAASEIREALTNLVLNAVDAMPQGGVLTLRTCVGEPGQVQLEVSDTGVGMDEAARRRCLEPFFTTKGERGTGLGLAMVYGVAQRHSAEIDIDSAVGKGTTVRLRFGAAVSAVMPEETVAVSVPTGLRILIVDDDPVLLRSLRDTLEADGHEVVAANGGQEGIDLCRLSLASNLRFDVAITDLGMPYVDGRQVAAALKAMAPSTPVIMLTGWGQRLVTEGDIPAHVDLVLNKPPKLRELRDALARCAGGLQA
jgi:signal transduction histidine kinase/CheY-like chemotaxis protein